MLDRMLLASASEEKLYSEDVFSTYLYTGNGSSQTITNGIDLAGKGGMVWVKARDYYSDNALFDTARGATKVLYSNGGNGQSTQATSLTAFNNNGFSVDSLDKVNADAIKYTSWSFRKAPKFCDILTWTGNGASSRTLTHALGSAPGFIVIKRTDATTNWIVWHQDTAPNCGRFNGDDAFSSTVQAIWSSNAANITLNQSLVGAQDVNTSGATYVAYLFAHDPTADGIIQCGSYTGNGSATGPTVTLGWEPQWLMIKNTSGTGNWQIIDNMRGMPVGSADAALRANLPNAESSVDYVSPTATGFQVTSTSYEVNTTGGIYTYLAIRRGPMKTPTVGTSVFKPDFLWGTSTSVQRYLGYPADANILGYLDGGVSMAQVTSRLTGPMAMNTSQTTAQSTDGITWDTMLGSNPQSGSTANRYINYAFRRAPGFFDVVAYTGNGDTGYREIKHNLGVPAELAIVKRRSSTADWAVGYQDSNTGTQFLLLNSTAANTYPNPTNGGIFPYWNTDTFSTYGLSSSTVNNVNANGSTYVAYLFASCPGVSKVGSYTGNGSSQTINCGFSSGARFFLVKRTDSTGDWWVYDSARGIVAAADPALRLNSTAAEVTSADAVDTNSTGIIVNQEATCNINVNGATYIYLAIA